MNTERREHLKNLIRHSSDAKLIIYNPLLENETKCSESVKQIKTEIQEAIKYLEQDGVKITLTPHDEEHTLMHLKPGRK